MSQTDVPTLEVGTDQRASLATRLATLEYQGQYVGRSPQYVHRVREAHRLAAMHGWHDLRRRASLLQATVDMAQGDLVKCARIMEQTLTDAREAADQLLVGRTHGLLSNLFRIIGDAPECLRHAVRCVENTPEGAPSWMWVTHLTLLGIGLQANGSSKESNAVFVQALELADTAGDDAVMLAVLNNITFVTLVRGDIEFACSLGSQLREFAEGHELTLAPEYLDTLAQVEMQRGRYETAEEYLQQAIGDMNDDCIVSEADALLECLLSLAQCQRHRGAYRRAERTLARCQEIATQRGYANVAARSLEERARLLAATGDYRAAYRQHQLFFEAWRHLENTEREMRARVVHALYELDKSRRTSEQFRELAVRDPLTRLHNRRHVDQTLPVLLRRSRLTATPLSVAFLDLDHFKQVNDTISHEAGDTVLVTVADVMVRVAPGTVTVTRMGGEEFLLIMPGADAPSAAQLCDRLRVAVADFDWSPITGDIPITVSIGVATATGGVTAAALLAEADQNLYVAKRTGRNRVVAGTDPAYAAPVGRIG